MKKKTLLLLAALFLFMYNSYATNISGFISVNTTWNLAGSPYVVVGNALLSSGYTLIIDPGVVVKFNDSCALQIDGELYAIGTAANRITFTSNQPVPASGDWAKIQFSDSSVNAVFDASGNYLSGSIMKYCDVMYGGQLGLGVIQIERSSPYLSNCSISRSSSFGIRCYGESFRLDSSSVRFCSQHGLYFENIFISPPDLYIQNDTIENNMGGIYFYYPSTGPGANQTVFIRENVFKYNSQMGAIFFQNNFYNTIIINNIFESDSSQYGGGAMTLSSHSYTVSCNRFINNFAGNGPDASSAIRIYGGSTNDTNRITDNIFYGNSCSAPYNTPVCYVYEGINSVYFTGNYFNSNSATNSALCHFRGYTNGTFVTAFYISNNEYVNNQIKQTVFLESPGLCNFGLHYAEIHNNNFNNSASTYEIYNGAPFGGPNIEADSNYWGTTSTAHIDSVIYDYFDLANLSVVYYSPILTSPATVDTTCPPSGIIGTNDIEAINFTSTLFPNPFTTTATIKFTNALHSATFRLYNLYGQLVQSKNNISGREIILTRENLNNGVYVYEVTDKEKKICTGKAVVY